MTMADLKSTPHRKDNDRSTIMRDAKPLLQAIFLGIVLASGLVAAAALANSDTGKEISRHNPFQNRLTYDTGHSATPNGVF